LEIEPVEFNLNTDKSFKFLHISSGFPRKGVDILLEAYSQLFSIDDDVTLIIKTFPNEHNIVADEVKRISEKRNSPEIVLDKSRIYQIENIGLAYNRKVW